eukprot:11586389-Alexandrium_andersonii.AAC.1
MSASLVGSEMCIRDSPTTSPESCRLSRLRAAHEIGRPLFGQRPRDKGCPVSYTHLTLPTICSV